MSPRSFFIGLYKIILPTPLQALAAVLVSFVALSLINIDDIFSMFGFQMSDSGGIGNAVQSFIDMPILSDSSAIFAGVGLVLLTYLIGWIAYNGVVSSRTQVSAETGVIDTSLWLELMIEAAIKAAAGFALLEYLIVFRSVMGLWISWVPGVLAEVTFVSAGAALGAILGFALQLYLVFALLQMVLLPWYKSAE